MTEPKRPDLQHPGYMGRSFFGFADIDMLHRGITLILQALKVPRGVYLGDNLMVFGKSLSFLDDAAFRTAWNTHSKTPEERGAMWRRVTQVWAARSALRLEGDFMEVGAYKGVGPRIICDVLNFGELDRRYYLYDLFEHDSSMIHHHMTEHGADLFQQVTDLFPEKNVEVIKGYVPQSFEQGAPEKIAFMHLDLNQMEAEIATLEAMFDRIVPGGILLLDDFGWLGYRRQLDAETDWLGKRGYHVLEMPTGQGLVIK